MIRYENLNGDSGVQSYEIGAKQMLVKFKKGSTYLYSDVKPGSIHLEKMKLLAVAGKGLGTYINKYVRTNYIAKWG